MITISHVQRADLTLFYVEFDDKLQEMFILDALLGERYRIIAGDDHSVLIKEMKK